MKQFIANQADYINSLPFFESVLYVLFISFIVFWLCYVISIPFTVRNMRATQKQMKRININILFALESLIVFIESYVRVSEPDKADEIKECAIELLESLDSLAKDEKFRED